MGKAAEWISDWKHALIALGFGVLALLAAIFVPDERWTKLGTVLGRIVADPAGATVAVGMLAGAITTLRGAWLSGRTGRSSTPPGGGAALMLALALGTATAGCGASALQTSAVGVTVALRAEEAVTAAVIADLDARMTACPAGEAHGACVDHERASVADLTTALDALEIGIRAAGAAIATATEIDAGQPLPAIVLGAIRDVLALWDQIEVLMRSKGIDVPREIDMVIAALGALVQP